MQTGEFLEFNDRHKTAAQSRRSLLHLSPRRPAGRARKRARSQRRSSGTPPDGNGGAERPHPADVRQRRKRRGRDRDRRRRRALGHPPGALWRRQPDLHRSDGLARAAERQRCAGGGARADRPHPMGRAGLPSPRLLHPRQEAREHRHPGRHRQMGRGRLVDPRRSRRDAVELSQPRAAPRRGSSAS